MDMYYFNKRVDLGYKNSIGKLSEDKGIQKINNLNKLNMEI